MIHWLKSSNPTFSTQDKAMAILDRYPQERELFGAVAWPAPWGTRPFSDTRPGFYIQKAI